MTMTRSQHRYQSVESVEEPELCDNFSREGAGDTQVRMSFFMPCHVVKEPNCWRPGCQRSMFPKAGADKSSKQAVE